MALNESTLSDNEQREIKEICDRRGIENLIHFTQETNLENIFDREAILPIEDLEYNEVEINDTSRLDNKLDSISLSVEFPNYLMFHKYRKEKKEAKWLILELDCSILWRLDCAFYYKNAASSGVRKKRPSDFKGSKSFGGMFKNTTYKRVTVLREGIDIPSKFTTNPQAEILVFSEIPLRYINGVICRSYDEKSALGDSIGGIPVSRNNSYFEPRVDWKTWKNISDADRGDPEAKQKLGYRLVQGDKFQQDMDTAADLFLEAAREGVTAAQFNIGLCYEFGNGVEENLEEAKNWYQRSADNGSQDAEDKLNELNDSNSELDDDLPF